MCLRPRTLAVFLLGATIALPTAAHAQTVPEGPRYQQAISVNPFGLLLALFNAEYERVVSESSTAGFGGSYISRDNEEYLNADVFWRYFLTGRPLEGWSFGAKAGITDVPDQGTYFGFGFDFNRSWLLGKNDNFYLGLGFGLKRLVGIGDEDQYDDVLRFIPTIRIVNVGIAF